MTADSRIVNQLRGVASKLTSDAELQKDLLQEMFAHLFSVETGRPAQTPSWYVKSCEFHARNYLKIGRSIDSPKRARNRIPLDASRSREDSRLNTNLDIIDPLDFRAELIAQDIIDLVLPHLTETQQRILFLLLQGFGVREVARELGVSHPAVVKQRQKIARLVSSLLEDSGEAQRGEIGNRTTVFRGVCAPSGMHGVSGHTRPGSVRGSPAKSRRLPLLKPDSSV